MNKAVFREENHTYWLGEKRLISVTQLLKKHGITTDYSCVDPEVLARKAEYGTLVHKEIEDFIKNKEVGFTDELGDFIRFADDLHLQALQSEVLVNDENIAGTADLIALRADGKKVLIDYKTCARVNLRAVSWQLSLYERLSGIAFDEFYVFHFGAEKSSVIPIDRIPSDELDKLLACEREGRIFREKELIVKPTVLDELLAAEQKIAEIETAKKVVTETRARLYTELKKAMESQGVKSYEDDRMKVTYIAPQRRKDIDTKKLQEEQPEIAAKYVKETPVKSSVRVTLRGRNAG